MRGQSRRDRFTRRASVCATTVVVAGIAGVGAAGGAQAGTVVFNPDAYYVAGSAHGGAGGINVDAPPVHLMVKIPSIAPESLSSECSPNVDGKTSQAQLAGLDFGPVSHLVLSDQTVTDTGTEESNANEVGITEESKIEGLSALAGGITADVIDATAHTTVSISGLSNHLGAGDPAPTGLTVVNLKIFGQLFNGNIAPNTMVTLSANNYIVLNEQKPTATGVTVNALDIHLAGLDVFSGGVTVGHAQSTVKPSPSGRTRYTGSAYAANLSANVAGVSLKTGEIAEAGIGCFGGNASNSIAALSLDLPGLPNLGTSGTADATVTSGGTPTPHVNSEEDIEGLSLLGGLVTADALDVTSSTTDAAGLETSTGNTTFTNLVINGQPIAANPAPNTRIDIAGLGTLVLNKQTCRSPMGGGVCAAMNSEGLTVAAIALTVKVSNNSLQLPLSTNLTVAKAGSGLLT